MGETDKSYGLLSETSGIGETRDPLLERHLPLLEGLRWLSAGWRDFWSYSGAWKYEGSDGVPTLLSRAANTDMNVAMAKAWVSEAEYEVVRLEAEAIETASFGLGLLARVHKGSKAAFERRKVNGEEWLPASANYTASARVMLLKRLRIGGTSEFSDYRKFAVTTDTKVGTPK
jgi:hypothetical protein